jgi:hypothetical protein
MSTHLGGSFDYVFTQMWTLSISHIGLCEWWTLWSLVEVATSMKHVNVNLKVHKIETWHGSQVWNTTWATSMKQQQTCKLQDIALRDSQASCCYY